MGIKRSVGCNCCGPAPQPTPDCSLNVIVKGYPSYDISVPSYDREDHTEWSQPTDPDKDDWWSGDIPTEDYNIIPANSKVEFETTICCLEYLFEVELVHTDPLDDETVIRCGPMRYKVHKNNEWCIQSGMDYADTRIQRHSQWPTTGRRSVQFSSILDTYAFHNIAIASDVPRWSDRNFGGQDESSLSSLFMSCGSYSKFEDEVSNSTRTVKLTI